MDDFYIYDGKDFHKLGSISESDLKEEAVKEFDLEPVEIKCDLDFRKLLRAVLTQGQYNAYVLKQDGYLSPKNGWI